MQAVIFKGKLHVEVEQRPIPKIQDPKDIIVKVRYTALCGRCVVGQRRLNSGSLLTSAQRAPCLSRPPTLWHGLRHGP